LTPLCVGNYDKVSFFYLLCPYIEQQPLYDQLVTIGIGSDFSSAWFDGLTEEQKQQYSAIAAFKCPSRRSGEAYVNHPASDGGCANGPQADYAVVSIAKDRGKTGDFGDIRQVLVATKPQNDNVAAIRVAKLGSGTDYSTWKPRDTMARFIDGTSNTFVVGEKHIPSSHLGECKATANNEGATSWDCGMLAPAGGTPDGHSGGYTVNRWIGSFQTGIARSPSEDNDSAKGQRCLWNGGAGFGSYHTGVCNFLLGDGSVHPISVTVSRDNILYPLSDVRDGTSVSLP
jgi:hypothetical protein